MRDEQVWMQCEARSWASTPARTCTNELQVLSGTGNPKIGSVWRCNLGNFSQSGYLLSIE